MISFGTDSPFEPDDPIVVGANKQVTVKAATPGCYKYDAGAFYPGATYGMGWRVQARTGHPAVNDPPVRTTDGSSSTDF